uniref:Uncharacterized protein n=1 Tax=Glossina pallidipes TaxID=7398 RepID=A0A1A9ZSB3_GLOPL
MNYVVFRRTALIDEREVFTPKNINRQAKSALYSLRYPHFADYLKFKNRDKKWVGVSFKVVNLFTFFFLSFYQRIRVRRTCHSVSNISDFRLQIKCCLPGSMPGFHPPISHDQLFGTNYVIFHECLQIALKLSRKKLKSKKPDIGIVVLNRPFSSNGFTSCPCLRGKQ